uniref:Uncharacterized protein n=1 Tax=Arundo donax TaxID=35708 RepID=A0A0A9D4M6_ARUDO
MYNLMFYQDVIDIFGSTVEVKREDPDSRMICSPCCSCMVFQSIIDSIFQLCKNFYFLVQSR